MKLHVRPADLRRDRDAILELLRRNLTFTEHDARFDWLYHDNPAGQGWSWVVSSSNDDRPIGVASVFPYHFWIDGSLERGGRVGDFAVDAAYRSLGPAVKLQRATFEPVDQGLIKFCYDEPPHELGMAPFYRIGMSPTCQKTRLRLFLKADDVARRWFSGGAMEVSARVALNTVLRARGRFRSVPRDVDIEVLGRSFGHEFDDLDNRLPTDGRVRVRRSSEYLNWRFQADPTETYRTLTARRASELTGYAVYSDIDVGARLVDIAAMSEQALYALIIGVSDDARARGKEFVDCWAVRGSRRARVIERAGFVRRELSSRLVIYTSGSPDRVNELGGLDWA